MDIVSPNNKVGLIVLVIDYQKLISAACIMAVLIYLLEGLNIDDTKWTWKEFLIIAQKLQRTKR
jgi:hypothetical protein